jgi:MFS family permease
MNTVGKILLSLTEIKNKIFYGWVVIASGLLIGTTTFGVRYSFGAFFTSIESQFNLTRGATSVIFSVYMVLTGAVTVFGGWALDRYGPRIVVFLMASFTGLGLLVTSQATATWQLFFSYSLLVSLGTGATFGVVNSTVSRWFEKKRGFALGITTSGGALGTIVMPPFATYLISNFDWRTAFIIMGLIAWLVMVLLSIPLRKDPRDIGLLPDGIKPEVVGNRLQNEGNNTQLAGLSLLQALRTGSFWFFALAWLLVSSSVHLILTHTIPHAIDMSIGPIEAAAILSVLGGACILGRLVMGRLSDVIGRKAPAIICTLLQSGALVWLLYTQELRMFYLFAIVFGFGWGGFGAPSTALIGDVFGMRSIGAVIGTLAASWALGAAIGPAVGGFIYDIRGSYRIAFAVGAVSSLVATLFVVLIKKKTTVESN